jgi:hypothetical protein
MIFDPLNPPITCTQKELAFDAWQSAHDGQGEPDRSLDQSGNAWEAFCGWWNGRDFSYFANLRQLMRAAWNFSYGETESQMTLDADRARFAAWWDEIVKTGRAIAGG